MRISDWSSDVCSSDLQTDYPRTRPDLPNHEPRGCPRGASYSWYIYSAQRLKYPMVRSRLLKLWREARVLRTPVAAWASIVEDPAKRKSYTAIRGHGGMVRSTWDEVNEIIAAANAYTAQTYGPDRIKIGRASCRERVCQYGEISVV